MSVPPCHHPGNLDEPCRVQKSPKPTSRTRLVTPTLLGRGRVSILLRISPRGMGGRLLWAPFSMVDESDDEDLKKHSIQQFFSTVSWDFKAFSPTKAVFLKQKGVSSPLKHPKQKMLRTARCMSKEHPVPKKDLFLWLANLGTDQKRKTTNGIRPQTRLLRTPLLFFWSLHPLLAFSAGEARY